MHRTLRSIWASAAATAAVTAAVACSGAQAPAETTDAGLGTEGTVPSPAASTVQAYTAAFNAHDVNAMKELMAPDILWLSIVADSVVVEARGVEQLVSGMTAYFESFPDVQSDVEIGAEVGPFIHARETASWSSGGVRSTQASLSTYEVRNERIHRVWYFPAA